MLKSTVSCVVFLCLVGVFAQAAFAQAEPPDEDVIVDSIRGLATISPNDQMRIADWVRTKVGKLGAIAAPDRPKQFASFRDVFRAQYDHRDASGQPDNSSEFRRELAVQTASVAAAEFAKPDLDPTVARVLAQALVDMNRVDTHPGLIAGLRSTNAVVRLLCAIGLAARKTAIAADAEKFSDTISALREVGAVETQPVVLARIYHALAYRANVGSVFDSYIELFDRRLEHRRGPAVKADGAEIQAYDFFRTAGVVAELNTGQKARLAQRLAVFLRLDAQHYNDPGLTPPQDHAVVDVGFEERDKIERMLVAVEAILVDLAGGTNAIADALKAGGHSQREAILTLVGGWVGNSETGTTGTLNAGPWNVPVGAP